MPVRRVVGLLRDGASSTYAQAAGCRALALTCAPASAARCRAPPALALALALADILTPALPFSCFV